ncbi:helix-turn-helix domain-containing protein [Pelosinus sp. IPA-1]|uniref:winged helix-turn-helix transcriptional regulator n=1 Tax=Pelosinus sp. IPA-1 TaxID=3029569 RepID=UPI0024361FF7|nr:helix-turn-helix domain-containing protein [Pelosinus sp. IPA-1]GMA99046.1 putative HTH-type transcriptional regulator YdeP [Pelosinus sp. IPA-1]
MKNVADPLEKNDCTHVQCPVETTLDIIGGKWKGIILYRLLDGKKRFNELKRLLPNITHRTLTMQLRELESDGILIRHVYAEVPPKVEYRLSPLGLSMTPIITTIYNWGKMYQQNIREESKLSDPEMILP